MIEHLKSFNLPQWIAENRDLSGTKRCLWENSNFWAFVTWGPNERTVFHVNPGDEMFQQFEGQLQLYFVPTDGEPQLTILEPGDFFLLPAGIPHSPRREAGSWTLVVTPRRTPDAEERWLWYCDRCHAKLHEVGIVGRRMGEPVDELAEATRELKENAKLRTCSQCGHCSSV